MRLLKHRNCQSFYQTIWGIENVTREFWILKKNRKWGRRPVWTGASLVYWWRNDCSIARFCRGRGLVGSLDDQVDSQNDCSTTIRGEWWGLWQIIAERSEVAPYKSKHKKRLRSCCASQELEIGSKEWGGNYGHQVVVILPTMLSRFWRRCRSIVRGLGR